eukprot:scaffold22599_cov139-Cylindrotheca_fusiformis.AAC.17
MVCRGIPLVNAMPASFHFKASFEYFFGFERSYYVNRGGNDPVMFVADLTFVLHGMIQGKSMCRFQEQNSRRNLLSYFPKFL